MGHGAVLAALGVWTWLDWANVEKPSIWIPSAVGGLVYVAALGAVVAISRLRHRRGSDDGPPQASNVKPR